MFKNRLNGSHFVVEHLQLLRKLKKHTGCVNSLNFSRSGNLIVSGSDDLYVIVWQWSKGRPIQLIKSGHLLNVFQTKFVENTSMGTAALNIVTSARDGDVRQILVPPSGGAPVKRILTKHGRPVHKIALPDTSSNEILTAGEDGCVKQIDLRDKAIENILALKEDEHIVPLYSIATHPHEPEFCVAGRDRYVRVYDRRNTNRSVKMFCPQKLLKVKLETARHGEFK